MAVTIGQQSLANCDTKRVMPTNFKDLTGQRFAKLIAIERTPSNERRGTYWLCQCDCGNRIVIAARHLTSEKTKSCKCLWETRGFKHGSASRQNQTREYSAWLQAKARCFNPKFRNFKNWGGRGITMCDEWRNDFAAFLRDMGLCPEGHELDRYPNNDGNYEKGNCRWATHTENNRNKRDTICVTYGGETKPLIEWCEQVGLSHSTVWARLYVWHWPIEKALFSRGKRKWP